MTQFIDIQKQIKEIKKTVFTHELDERNGWEKTTDEINDPDFLKVIYLGKCSIDGDMFAVYLNIGSILIFKGVKGDEFI